MPQPVYLKKGDKISILSTARKISSAEIAMAIELAESWGLEVVIGKTINSEFNQFAGDDNLRLNDFQNALNDDSIKAIWCARGGYGTVRIIDEIDFRKFQKKPKWICGFSDVTVLHSHINNMFNVPTLHTFMPLNVNNENKMSEAAESMHKSLFGKKNVYEFATHPLNRLGKIQSTVVGGNLSILYSLAASQSDIDTTGKILLLEDLDEYLYHIDRMLLQLKRSGKLESLAGIIIGGMTEMNDNQIPFGKSVEEIIKEHVVEFDFPVCFNFPVGHQADNRAVKLGMEANLEVTIDRVMFKQ
jgi:muramoyltetrapeptide carboxypeptidase